MTISVGDTVQVVESGQTYTNYDTWSGVLNGFVPSFIDGAKPEDGDVYTVTYIGLHGNHSTTLYVLDNKYIVNDKALEQTTKSKIKPSAGNYQVANFTRARASGWSTVCNHYHVLTK